MFFIHGISQGYGGKIKLKFTYEGSPLVGYDITTSINNVNISGGTGKTDSQGVVNLNTEPLPIGDIDVKGEIVCNNSTKKFEASGFVHVSPSNDNYFELKLEKVAKQMAEFSGMSIDMIMESFGVNCARSGGLSSSSNSSSASNNTNVSNSSSSNNSATSSNSTNTISASEQQKKEHDDWSAQNENRREESAAKRDEFMVNSSPEQGYQNQKDMLTNQIYKLDKKISGKESDLNDSKLKTKDKNDLQYDIKEMQVEKAIKQNKLDKVNAIIAKGNKPLNKAEKESYKQKEESLKDELDQVKEDRKKGVSLVSANANTVESTNDEEGVDMKEIGAYTEAEVQNMSDVKLKSAKVGVKTKLNKKKVSLKAKAKVMKQDKKAILEKEIELLEKTVGYIEAEIESRKED